MNFPEPNPHDGLTDPLLAAFAAQQTAAAESPDYVGDPISGLHAKADAIFRHLESLEKDSPPPDARARIAELVKSLVWPVKTDNGIRETPLALTLAKQDLAFRVWRQDSQETERARSWPTQAIPLLFIACHSIQQMAHLMADLRALIIVAYNFWDAQIANYDEKNLAVHVLDALWEGHHANMAAPAAAPYAAFDSGNAPGRNGNTPSGLN